MEAALHVVVVLFFLSAIQADERRVYRSTDQCPQPDFLPSLPPSGKHCAFSDNCSRAECVVTQGPHKLTVILKINWCHSPLTATVTLQQPDSNLDWSHTFEDGEKAKLGVTPSMFSGGLPVANASLFVQVGLKKTKGNSMNYTVALIENVTTSVVNPMNVMLLQGNTAVWTGDCATCPPAHFNDGTVCPVTNHCSKITCTSPDSDGGMMLTVQMNGCSEPLTATVTMGSSLSAEKWSHTFENGGKAEPPMPSGGGDKVHYELKVKWEKTYVNIKFQLTMSIKGIEESSASGSVSTLTAELPLPKCDVIPRESSSEEHTPKPVHRDEKSHDLGTCSPAHFSDGSVCPVTNHCSKITCTSPESDGGMMLTVQMNGCSEPLTATVTMGSSLSAEKWSHTFENGGKAEPPMPSGGGDKIHYELKVEWEKTNVNIKFQLTMSIEGIEESSKFGSVSILTAELALPKCGSLHNRQASSHSKWFSKQPNSVKVLVIFLPVLVLVFVGLGVAFYCYRNSGRGVRYSVHLTAGGSKVAMQRLTNEI